MSSAPGNPGAEITKTYEGGNPDLRGNNNSHSELSFNISRS